MIIFYNIVNYNILNLNQKGEMLKNEKAYKNNSQASTGKLYQETLNLGSRNNQGNLKAQFWNMHRDYSPKHPALCSYTFALCVGEVSIVLPERTKVEFIESFWKTKRSV